MLISKLINGRVKLSLVLFIAIGNKDREWCLGQSTSRLRLRHRVTIHLYSMLKLNNFLSIRY